MQPGEFVHDQHPSLLDYRRSECNPISIVMPYKHIVITSVPFTDTVFPLMAPAILKSIVEQNNISCRAFDLNATVYRHISTHSRRDDIANFFMFGHVTPDLIPALNELFEIMLEETMRTNPDLVCLSLMHYQCKRAATWLSFFIKRSYPSVEIMFGGPGINDDINSNSVEFVQNLQRHGTVDHYIYGDGEHALDQFLKGNTAHPGINTVDKIAIEDLDALPYPNYDDYNFDLYEHVIMGILGSRGCVRQCTFCDVHETWTKYNWRTGDNIFEEIMYQNKRYGVRHFKFQDNLINGNVKEYTRLTTLLAEHNQKNPENSIRWTSFFIFRPKTSMSEKDWQLTAASGARTLQVGIENLTEKGRFHMKKKFSNADIDYSLSMAKKYNIKVLFIVMVGYVTETEQDHQETLKWIYDNRHYAGNPIEKVQLGGGLAILPNTWLSRNQKELGVTWKQGAALPTYGANHLWEIKATGNNYETRLRRLAELVAACKDNGFYTAFNNVDPQKELEDSFAAQLRTYKRESCD